MEPPTTSFGARSVPKELGMNEPLTSSHKVDILKARYAEQAENLRSLNLFELRVVGGYLTVQLASVGWFLANGVSDVWGKAIFLVVDFALLFVSLMVIKSAEDRRWEITTTVWNINEAFGLYRVGEYLPDKPINPDTRRPREIFWWYYLACAIGFLGVTGLLCRVGS
jgi:hypothetical protein